MSTGQTVKELREECKRRGIRGYSKMTRDALLSVLFTSSTVNQTTTTSTPTHRSQPPSQGRTRIRFIDLFCGIGGFHSALTSIPEIDAECVLACDIDEHCRQVYQTNYGMMPVKNVKDIDETKMPEYDVLCGGFPCQAFSNAGRKKTFEDERGLLFDEIARIARATRPRFMFLENVKHILKVDDGQVFDYIMAKLDAIGYHVDVFQISPHEYGIPQERERVYFACIRKDLYSADKKVELIKPINAPIEFARYLDPHASIPNHHFINGDILYVLNAWDEMIRQFGIGEKISPTILVNEFYTSYTTDEFKQLPAWKQEYITKNRPLYIKYKTQWDAWYERHRHVLQKREIYCKLEWQTGPIKEGDSIFNHFIQLRQSGIRVKRAKYFPTLVAICQIPIYGKEKRYITPRECARLQSFPETFQLHPTDKVSYKQMGNSVNVSNVRTVIDAVFQKYVYAR
jgi:DNA (cytosine-5)-methyltransferase 1